MNAFSRFCLDCVEPWTLRGQGYAVSSGMTILISVGRELWKSR